MGMGGIERRVHSDAAKNIDFDQESIDSKVDPRESLSVVGIKLYHNRFVEI